MADSIKNLVQAGNIETVVVQGGGDGSPPGDPTPPDGRQSGSDHPRGSRYSLPKRRPSELFVGRDEELLKLEEVLAPHGERSVAVHQPSGVSASGGVGKTELAIEFAWRQWEAGRFPGGCYFLSADSENCDAALESIAGPVGVEPAQTTAETAALVREAIASRRDEPALLVIDNVESPEAWETWDAALPGPPARKLITTREPRLGPGIELLPLGRLSVEACVRLLTGFRQSIEGDDAATQAASEIAEWLDGWAVAVALVGAYLYAREEIAVEDFRDELREKGLKTLRATESDPEAGRFRKYDQQVDLLMDELLEALRPHEVRLVEYASLLPEDTVPLSWLRELLDGDDVEIETLPGEKAPIDGAIKRLIRLDLFRPRREVGELVAMHRVVRRRVRETIGAEA